MEPASATVPASSGLAGRLAELLALALVLVLAVSLRSASLGALHETYTLDNDSYRFLRIAEASAAGRPIGARDMQRWLPAGRDMSTHLSLHSALISGLYRAAGSLGLHPAFRPFALRYPIACFALCPLVLYAFLARRGLATAGLAAGLGLAVAPATVYRGSAGFVDRDPTCLLLALCAYSAYAEVLCATRPGSALAGAIVCGALSAVLGSAWEGVGLFTVALAVTLAWAALGGALDQSLTACHVLWCVVALPPLLLFTHAYWRVGEPYALLALFPLPLVCLVLLLTAPALRALRGPRAGSPLHRRWLSLALLGLLAAAGGLAAAVRCPPRFPETLRACVGNAISACGPSPLERSIDELRNMFVSDWRSIYGFSLLLFVAGISKVAAELGGERAARRYALAALAAGCSVAILASNDIGAWLRPSAADACGPPDGGLAGGVIRLVMLPTWFAGAAILSVRSTSRGTLRGPVSGRLPSFIVTWWLLLLAAAAGAQRYTFFLDAVGWLSVGYALSRTQAPGGLGVPTTRSPDRLAEALALVVAAEWGLWAIGLGPLRMLLSGPVPPAAELAVLTTASGAALAALAQPQRTGGKRGGNRRPVPIARAASFAIFACCIASSATTARGAEGAVRPVYGWLHAYLEAMSHRLPADAVVLAGRDYGSPINVLAKRATVIDEDHYGRDARIGEFAREAYCADDPVRAAAFLVRNGVTHWLLTGYDADPYPAALLGSGSAPPAELRAFPLVRPRASPRRPGGMVVFVPPPGGSQLLTDRLTLGRLGSSPKRTYVVGAYVRLSRVPGGKDAQEIEGGGVILASGALRRRLTPKWVVFRGRRLRQAGDVLPGILFLEPDPRTGAPTLIYLPERASRCLGVRLFVLHENVPQFHAMEGLCPSAGTAQLARVWKVCGAARSPAAGPLQRSGGLRAVGRQSHG